MSASRGAVFMTVAQGLFVVTSAFLHFWLGHRLGPARYGIFGVLLVIYSLVNLIENSGVWPAMSKRIAEAPDRAAPIFRSAMNLQSSWVAAVTVLGLAAAWPLAGVLRDPSLAPMIALTIALVPLFALYSLANGFHNGRHAFGTQAAMLVGYSLGRLAMTLWLVTVLPSPMAPVAALVGFAVSPLFGLAAGLRGLPRPGRGSVPWRELAGFAGPVAVAAGAMVVVMSLDVLSVKAILGPGHPDVVGNYNAASTIASLPYYAFSSLSVVVLPAVASARAEQGIAKAAAMISDSLRLVIVLLFPVVLLPSALSGGLVSLFYGGKYAGAGTPLTLLLIGYGFLAYALIEQNVANGLGRPRTPMVAGIFAVAVSLAANLLLIPRWGLLGAASATTLAGVAMVLATRPALAADGVTSGMRRWLPSLAGSLAAAWAVSRLAPSAAMVLPALAGGLAAALGVSFIARALDRADLRRFF